MQLSISSADKNTHIQKWCDRWHKLALKNKVTQTKLFAKEARRPNVKHVNYHLTLIVIGNPPVSHSFGALTLDDITGDVLRKVTKSLMEQLKVPDFEF